MTSKHRRQRGSRTHGGGTHKNRRGAGHRGGRGKAGRSKHEFHNHEELGDKGFKPPNQRDFVEVKIQKLDEDAALLVADGLAEETDSGYRIDAREVVDTESAKDGVKVLGNGQVRQELEVIADAFTQSAVEMIVSAGGDAIEPEEEIKTGEKSDDIMDDYKEYLEEKRELVEQGDKLSSEEIDKILEVGLESTEIEPVYDLLLEQYDSVDELSVEDAVSLCHLKIISEEYSFDTSEVDYLLEEYFSDVSLSEEHFEEVSEGLPEHISISEIREILRDREESIREADKMAFDDDPEARDKLVSEAQKTYLYLVQDRLAAGV